MRVFSIAIFFILVIMSTSCLQDKRPKDVDSFYFSKNYGQFPLLPLSNPVVLYYDKVDDNWSIDMLDYNFNHTINMQNLKSIGIDKTYIYGKKKATQTIINEYKKGDFVYAGKYGGISWSSKPIKFDGDIRLYPSDSSSKVFTIPKRWFVINVVDSTTEAFFSKKKYEAYLKEKGISGKMYDINTYYKQYKETGIVPWFPDSVKAKLRN